MIKDVKKIGFCLISPLSFFVSVLFLFVQLYPRHYCSGMYKSQHNTLLCLFLLAVPKSSSLKMPCTIERCVRKQNILFMHDKNQFSVEYFQFMRKLLLCNAQYVTLQSPQDKLVCYRPHSNNRKRDRFHLPIQSESCLHLLLYGLSTAF